MGAACTSCHATGIQVLPLDSPPFVGVGGGLLAHWLPSPKTTRWGVQSLPTTHPPPTQPCSPPLLSSLLPSNDLPKLFATAEERQLLHVLLLHCADISNPVKPTVIADKWAWLPLLPPPPLPPFLPPPRPPPLLVTPAPLLRCRWADRVLAEFFAQGDRERAAGQAISPMCDRGSVSRAQSQINFIEFVVMPVFVSVSVQFIQGQGVVGVGRSLGGVFPPAPPPPRGQGGGHVPCWLALTLPGGAAHVPPCSPSASVQAVPVFPELWGLVDDPSCPSLLPLCECRPCACSLSSGTWLPTC